MNDNVKTPGLNNPESYVLKYVGFNTYIVLLFTDLKKAQIYEMPYRDSPHREVEILMSFDYLCLFRPSEHTEDYHIRKPNNKIFYSKLKIKNVFMWEKIHLVLKQMM